MLPPDAEAPYINYSLSVNNSGKVAFGHFIHFEPNPNLSSQFDFAIFDPQLNSSQPLNIRSMLPEGPQFLELAILRPTN